MMRSALERCVGKTNLKYKNTLEGFPSGQREQTVNLPALPSMVRIRPPPPYSLKRSKSQLTELAFFVSNHTNITVDLAHTL